MCNYPKEKICLLKSFLSNHFIPKIMSSLLIQICNIKYSKSRTFDSSSFICEPLKDTTNKRLLIASSTKI